MKVLLVKPFNLSDHVQPSLGLGYLTQSIRPDHEVTILDCIKERIRLPDFRRYVERNRPQVVGFQTYTYDLPFVREALAGVKSVDPAIRTVIGGPHPSSVPETIFTVLPQLDAGFRAEAEIGFKAWLDGRPPPEIPGLIYKDGQTVRVNPPGYIEHLDALPLPAWDLIRPETYPESQHGFFYRNFPIAPIMLTRGCPYQCTFCAAGLISGYRIRRRSVPHVLAEIRYLYHQRGIREFHIVDDNFTMDPKYTLEFLQALKDLKLNISWATPNGVRMNTLTPEILQLMKETGLYLISVGIESGSDRILEKMKKRLTVSAIRRHVATIALSGIAIAGFFILGFPSETPAEIRQTIDLALDLPLIRANFFTYLPFPGTSSYAELEACGELADIDWNRFYFMTGAYVLRGLTRLKLKWLQRYAFIRFYMRPRIFVKTLAGIRSWRHLGFSCAVSIIGF
jgi:radical SAM superfamily enzyme YgiQ (UPF0313 family)